jgi:serine/threonine protein kinase/tetratricopeptide (TPR) repeat protein
MNAWDTPTVEEGSEGDADGATSVVPTKLGHFEIVGRLGAGGMGLVFEGRDALLDRRVALKLIHPSVSGHIAPARLLREAQALARLSHPNVVTVFEVGMVGDNPFIAMELVEGTTLEQWMREKRDWRDVLDMFIAIGRGLAAVHALGLVHRDFKPSNVLVDMAGVPKLGDFGLVGATDDNARRAITDRGEDDPSTDATDRTNKATPSSLTKTGSVMGTPAYMAPEQKVGAPVDARADQFAYGKSLAEALHEPMPAALAPVLARAQQIVPTDRFPSVDALIDELVRIRRGNRNKWIAAGASTAVVAVVLGAWSFGRAQSSDDACQRPTDRLADVWNARRSSALATHLVAIDPAFGAQRFASARAVFDRGADRWLDQNVEACQLTRAGRQSDALLDRRMTCLDRALFEMNQTVGLVEKATNAIQLDEAMRAAVSLPMLDECADVEALTERLPQPANPAQRATAEELARETVEIDVMLRTGGTRTGVASRATAAVARARSLEHPGTLARTLRSLAHVQIEDELGPPAIETLREAIRAASAAHDDRVVVDLWSRLLQQFINLKQHENAMLLLPAAEAAVARTTPTLQLSSMFAEAKAQVLAANGDVTTAHAILAESIAALEAAGARDPGSPLAQRYVAVKNRDVLVYALSKDWGEMATRLRALVELTEKVYGTDHPQTQRLHFNLGVAYRMLRDNDAALVAMKAAARIGEARAAPSPNLVSTIQAVGSTLYQQGKYEEAAQYLRRALEMARAVLPAGDRRLAGPVGDMGATMLELNRPDEARALMQEQLALFEKTPVKGDINWAHSVFNLGDIEFRTGNCAAAIPYLERAHTMYLDAGEKDHYDADSTLVLIAVCQINLKEYAAAQKTAERVLAQKDSSPEMLAAARFARGRALHSQGNPQGKAEVLAARAEMLKHELAAKAAEVDAWLGGQRATGERP